MANSKRVGKEFSWKKAGAQFKGHDAQAVGEALEKLREEHGEIAPEDVVNLARSPKSPLHELFPWDDKAAARIARELIAQQLIRSIHVTIYRESKPPIDTRAFPSIKKGDGPRHYTSMETALEDPDGRTFLLRQAWLAIKSWRRQYAELTELAEVFDVIDAALEKRSA